MSQKSKNNTRSRFDKIIKDYVNAVEKWANPEEIHSRLHGLLSESIRMNITLAELLEILSSSCMGGKTSEFIANVSSHYAQGEDAAKLRFDENIARKEAIKKKKS
ncbi:MAG: hypothetical protein PQ612_09090 [Rickettsiales bacterium]|nr:hypothetical protein [Pseudomonadota bacterium]MDA0967211.1 hypothetical protein [Pseudomonadota bacterium]MDG4544128.1 hypothetical protein [Rickettsiales bacterium]MDG4546309.1 hypothetical protein [Rickettsiales bacterium]MDG4548452.1 hypothetical protein [Rickettsiales bacterium]